MQPAQPILIALLVAAVPVWAQNSTAPAEQAAARSADTSALILARNPDENTSAPDAGLEPLGSPLSPELAGELAVGAPRYATPAPLASAAAADKPRGDVPRLPESTLQRFVVHGSRVNGFSDHDMLTTGGLIEVSFHEHPGLRVGNLLNLNAPAAYAAFQEEERLSKMADLNDTALAMQAGDDPAEARLIQDEAAEAYMRTEDREGPVGIR